MERSKGFSLIIVLMFMLISTIAAVGLLTVVRYVDQSSGAIYHSTIAREHSIGNNRQFIAGIGIDADMYLQLYNTYAKYHLPIKINDSVYVMSISDNDIISVYTIGYGPMHARYGYLAHYKVSNIITQTVSLFDEISTTYANGKLDKALWIGDNMSATSSIYTVGGVYAGNGTSVVGSLTVNGDLKTSDNWSMTGSTAIYGNYEGPVTLSWPPHYITGSQNVHDSTTESMPIMVDPNIEAMEKTWSDWLDECGLACSSFSRSVITGANLDTLNAHISSDKKRNGYLAIDVSNCDFNGGTTSTKNILRTQTDCDGKIPGQTTGVMVFVAENNYSNFEVDGTFKGLCLATGNTFTFNTVTFNGSFVSGMNTDVDVFGSLRADFSSSIILDVLSSGFIFEYLSDTTTQSDSVLFQWSYKTKISDQLNITLISLISPIFDIPVYTSIDSICPYVIPYTISVTDSNKITDAFLKKCNGVCTDQLTRYNMNLMEDDNSYKGILKNTVVNNNCSMDSYALLNITSDISSSNMISSSITNASSSLPVSSSLIISSSKANSSSSSPCIAWNPSQHWSTYSLGDKRSDGGKYWRCINPSWAQSYAPSSTWGYMGWEISTTCL